ncbi:MAG: arginine--tRNA ligase [Nanoarchaeota archaeon]|nr:arginine--tRNA ligase [Nanoarchaeota archaeon]
MDFKKEIAILLAKATNLSVDDILAQIAVPPNPALGDYSFPCFKLGKNAKEEAEKIKLKIKLPKFLSDIKVAGPYLNFFLNKAQLAEETLTHITKEKKKYGAGQAKEKILIEYCGPNTNKPLHLGHVRNMALGNAMCRILAFQGNTVHPVNIINDRGIHICKSMLAYQKWGENKKPDKKSDHYVGDYYVLYAKKSTENPDLEQEAQKMLVAWEKGDTKVRALWKKMNSWVLKGFAQTYKRFGITFDREYFESELYEAGKEVALEGLHKKIFIKDEKGSIVAPLESHGLPNKVLLRGDGTSVYMTQDLYLAQKRYEDYHFDRTTYVVASEQKLHFQQLFKIMELLHRPYASKLYHLSYGMVHLPTGRMKSREGTVIDADDIMDEMKALAETEIRKRYQNLAEKEIHQRAEMIGLAAIKFFMLRTDAHRDIVFNPEESLSFEGETGPYVQYTHARSCSIVRKAGKVLGKVNYGVLQQDKEKNIIAHLLNFKNIVDDAARNYRPHVLCHYLIELAQAFNEFYHACPVISEDKELMKARLALVDAVRQVLENGLHLLGIEAPKEM